MDGSSRDWLRYGMYLVVSLFVVGTLLPALSTGQGAEGIVTVHVYDGNTQQPIVDAGVILDYTNKVYYTDERGFVIITGVAFGFHTLTVFKEGYKTAYTNFNLTENLTTLHIPLEPASPPTTGVIKGQVFLEKLVGGRTAGDAIIGFESPSHVSTGVLVDVMGTSDPYVGEFVAEVPAGTHHLWCWAYSHHVEHSGPIRVTAGNVTYHDFYLKYVDMSNSGLAGNVTDANTGAPINGATVIAYNEDTGDVLYTLTDSDGFYFFTGPWAGSYIVVAMAPGYNPGSGTGVVSWGEVTYVDIALKPNRTESQKCSALWGFVFGDGIPLSTGWVFTDYGVMVHSNLFGVPGLYFISCFPAGSPHHVGAWAPRYYPAFASVTVPPSTILRHDFYLQSGNYSGMESLIIGDVLYTATSNPVNGATVHLASSTTWYSGTYTCPSTSNLFFFAVVTAGPDYLITATKSGYTYTGYSIDGGTPNPPGTTFTVPPASIITLHLYMSREGENKTCLWGFVYYGSLSGPVATGVPVKILTPAPGAMEVTNSVGMYYFSVTPGTYSETPLITLPTSVLSYDHGTSSYGPAVWSGTISPGECRRVDFILRWQGPDNDRYGSIAGQVLDISTGTPTPVDNFEVKVYSSSSPPLTMLSGSTAPGTGYFQFTGLHPTSITWTIDGYDTAYIYTVDHVEYYIPASSTTSSTSPGLPTTFTLPPDATWFYIYVNKTGNEGKAIIWGYLYDYTLSPLPGRYIKIINPPGGGVDTTDPSGKYIFYVTPGTYTVTPILIGAGSVVYYDYNIWSSGLAPWHDTVSAGEVRHVDFVVKDYRPPGNCSAIAGVAYVNPSTPLSGVYVKASVTSVSYGVCDFTDAFGLFNFHPLCGYLGSSWTWVFTADMPGFSLDRIEYHLLGSSTITTVSSPTFTFSLPSSSIMWVEIYYNKTQPCNGTVWGKVYKLFSYNPAAGATVEIFSVSDPTTPVDSTVLGPDGIYIFTVPAGNYMVRATLSGYIPDTETVTVYCGDDTYVPLYLRPRLIPIPRNITVIRFVFKDNSTPIPDATVIIGGVEKFVTDDEGSIKVHLTGEGNYSIELKLPTTTPASPDSIRGAVVVAIATDDGEELSVNPDGTFHLKPGEKYVAKVVMVGPFHEKPTPKGEEKKGFSTSTLAGAVIASLIVGCVAGFLLRGRPGEGNLGE